MKKSDVTIIFEYHLQLSAKMGLSQKSLLRNGSDH